MLALITYEVIVGILRHRKAAKRQGELDSIVKILSDFMFQGQSLQQGVPDPHIDWKLLEPWMKTVADWSVETTQTLSGLSAGGSIVHARNRFRLIRHHAS